MNRKKQLLKKFDKDTSSVDNSIKAVRNLYQTNSNDDKEKIIPVIFCMSTNFLMMDALLSIGFEPTMNKEGKENA